MQEQSEIRHRKIYQGAVARDMKILIENTPKETLGESLLKKSTDSSYSDFGNTFQNQMNNVLEESNWKYASRMQAGFKDSSDSGLQRNISNAAGKTRSAGVQYRLHKTGDHADWQRDKEVQSSNGNDGGNPSYVSSTMAATTYDADKRSHPESSPQRSDSDQTTISSDDSKTSSDIQLNRPKHESPDRANEQKSDASKSVNAKSSVFQSTTEDADESSDKSNISSIESTPGQQNLVSVDTLQRSAETITPENADAKIAPDSSASKPGIMAEGDGSNPSLPITVESSGKETIRDLTANGSVASSLPSPAEFSGKETVRDPSAKGSIDSFLAPAVESSVNQTAEASMGSQAEAANMEAVLGEAIITTTEAAAGPQMSPTAEQKGAPLGAIAPATVYAASASRKSPQVVSDITDESSGKKSITNDNPIQKMPIHIESTNDSKSRNGADDSQSFTDGFKQNHAEAALSLKAGEDNFSSRLGQNTEADFLEPQTSLTNELFLRVAQQNHQENALPGANIKSQNVEYRLDNALLPGSNMANVSLSGSTVGNLTQPVSATKPQEFIHQLADRIQVLVLDPKGVLRIQLKPENLGQMEIRAENTTSGVVAKITTGSRDISNLLEANIHLLQQALQDQGLKVDRINIFVQHGLDASGSSGYNAQSGNTGSEGNEQTAQLFSKSETAQSDSQPDEPASDLASRTVLNPNIRFHRIA